MDLITFPPGVLGDEPRRIRVLARGEGWFAVDKPAGLALAADALHPEGAPSLAGAIHAAALAGKPQLTALGIGGCSRIHSLDAEASGVAILACGEGEASALRNSLGSGRWEFTYQFLAQGSSGEPSITCDLPIAKHPTLARMIVSHRQGKRCATIFTREKILGGFELWTALTRENRPNQVRLHAAESGLRLLGEYTYGRVPPVLLSSLKRKYRPGRHAEQPLHPGLALHLQEVRFPAPGSAEAGVRAGRPKTFDALVRRLEEHA